MSENIVDLSECQWLSDCPQWWQNFINYVVPDESVIADVRAHDLVNAHLSVSNGHVTETNDQQLYHVVFATGDDLNAFKLYWALRGS